MLDLNIKKTKKAILYFVILAIGVLALILMYIFNKPDGVLGFLACIASIYLIIGSVIKLCKLTKDPLGTFANLLDLLFWLP